MFRKMLNKVAIQKPKATSCIQYSKIGIFFLPLSFQLCQKGNQNLKKVSLDVLLYYFSLKPFLHLINLPLTVLHFFSTHLSVHNKECCSDWMDDWAFYKVIKQICF